MSTISKEQEIAALGKLSRFVEFDGLVCRSKEKLNTTQQNAITTALEGLGWHRAGYEETVKLIGQHAKITDMALDTKQRIATGERGLPDSLGGPCAIIPNSGELIPLFKSKYKTSWSNIPEGDRKDILEKLESVNSKSIAWVDPGRGDIVIGFGEYSKEILHIDATGRDSVTRYAGALWVKDAVDEKSKQEEITQELLRKCENEIKNLETFVDPIRLESLKRILRIELGKSESKE
jgi:hypothetical protein